MPEIIEYKTAVTRSIKESLDTLRSSWEDKKRRYWEQYLEERERKYMEHYTISLNPDSEDFQDAPSISQEAASKRTKRRIPHKTTKKRGNRRLQHEAKTIESFD
jgi:hypothetical protein